MPRARVTYQNARVLRISRIHARDDNGMVSSLQTQSTVDFREDRVLAPQLS